jgi:hypothetical protein
MRQRRVIRTTLGELIVAVTDEVVPIIRNPSGLYAVVSCIINDLFANHQIHIHKRSWRNCPDDRIVLPSSSGIFKSGLVI